MKRLVLPILLILTFGVLKTPVETRLLASERAHGFQAAQLNLQLRAQLGQMGFVAALSGFRAFMADLLWIRAQTAFEKAEWVRMKLLMESATQLQPKFVMFWVMAHFHMAYDAATAVKEKRLQKTSEGLQQPTETLQQPTEALQRKAEREYLQIGEQFLLDGIAFNPDSALLYERLGYLYSKKLFDYERAYEAYTACAQKPGAMGYIPRFAAYALAEVPGREREAYAKLRELYDEGASQRLPSLLHLLQRLEEKLAIPAPERVHIPPSLETARPAPLR